MTFQTPGAPAAKRRRIEEANATLRKPFRSPLISRRDGNPPGSESQQNSPSVNRGSFSTKINAQAPTTPAPARGYRSSSAATPLSSVQNRAPSAAGPKAPASPTSRQSCNPGRGTTELRPGTAAGENPAEQGDLLHQLHLAQADLGNLLRSTQSRLDLARQARHIEQASATKSGPGEPVDAELRAMTARWKSTSRQAAEELFGLIRERVEGMGGVKAWGATRRWQHGSSWATMEGESTGGRKGDTVGEEGNGVFEGEEVVAVEEEKKTRDEEEEEDAESSLNIEPDVLGYDPVEEKWRD
ncbi:hypothetical protein MYCTH_2295193 [Thermothelomyces thermophilus ATCC 42464]|uniref:Swi5-dependent recombination DNA repair protein 1 n=1 Tax=Thermothelomyces thermophilus (strain ATCC 42464 / BCRC 31852 / DSM 1799) TaxID=573729 RepID=G2Q421_THET4|nr:uncharacterized protein MYCTH_2295193 [Thermothelomyces thermophilus ATCC 42464]AEO53620.1 hypothetical protein MYCTH_2295193 [Thermothelomyces thermophilus ATCC 42464]